MDIGSNVIKPEPEPEPESHDGSSLINNFVLPYILVHVRIHFRPNHVSLIYPEGLNAW